MLKPVVYEVVALGLSTLNPEISYSLIRSLQLLSLVTPRFEILLRNKSFVIVSDR